MSARTKGMEDPNGPETVLVIVANPNLGVYFEGLSKELARIGTSRLSVKCVPLSVECTQPNEIKSYFIRNLYCMGLFPKVFILFEKGEVLDSYIDFQKGFTDSAGEITFVPIWFDKFIENWYLFHLDIYTYFNTRTEAVGKLNDSLKRFSEQYEPSREDMYVMLDKCGDRNYAADYSRNCVLIDESNQDKAATNAYILTNHLWNPF
jgi:hypothetical protein